MVCDNIGYLQKEQINIESGQKNYEYSMMENFILSASNELLFEMTKQDFIVLNNNDHPFLINTNMNY